ncbi:hypothetical protein M885DRAFT_290322 [Pelagophyceae sp. CCMP2097]|nr:hypothetical protein M885DRAFT_290322 [Pelagophyceae sp. CCMP2097]
MPFGEGGRGAFWQSGRVAGLQSGRVAGWQSGKVPLATLPKLTRRLSKGPVTRSLRFVRQGTRCSPCDSHPAPLGLGPCGCVAVAVVLRRGAPGDLFARRLVRPVARCVLRL